MGSLFHPNMEYGGFLRVLVWGAASAERRKRMYSVVGSSGQFRLGERPTANGRGSTTFSIKRIQTTEDVLL